MNTSSTIEAPSYRDRPRPQQLPGGLHGLSRREVTASQRGRIKNAMVEVIGEAGYPETNVREVIGRAGVSRKTFYELYASKDDCLFEIYDETIQCLRAVIHRAYEHGVTPQERIDGALGVLVEWMSAEPELARLCVLETPTAGPAGRERITSTLTWLTGVMADALGDLDVPEVLPELIVGGLHQMLAHRLVTDVDDLTGLTADLDEVWTSLERWAQ